MVKLLYLSKSHFETMPMVNRRKKKKKIMKLQECQMKKVSHVTQLSFDFNINNESDR